jgi:hypothetical protein
VDSGQHSWNSAWIENITAIFSAEIGFGIEKITGVHLVPEILFTNGTGLGEKA